MQSSWRRWRRCKTWTRSSFATRTTVPYAMMGKRTLKHSRSYIGTRAWQELSRSASVQGSRRSRAFGRLLWWTLPPSQLLRRNDRRTQLLRGNGRRTIQSQALVRGKRVRKTPVRCGTRMFYCIGVICSCSAQQQPLYHDLNLLPG